LKHLQFILKNYDFNRLAQQTIFSSNLLKLNANLENFNDCLYLLDGRFEKLHTLCINISSICSDRTIENKIELIFLNKTN